MNYNYLLSVLIVSATPYFYGSACTFIPNSSSADTGTAVFYKTAKTAQERNLLLLSLRNTAEDRESIKRLLQEGTSPNICYFSSDCLYILADKCIEENKVELISLLCEHGLYKDPYFAVLACQDKTGSPKRLAILQKLIEHNILIDVNVDRAFGKTALMAAAAHHVVFVKYLLDHGANVNRCDYDEGRTALMMSAQAKPSGQEQAINSALISAKANPLIKDKEGKLAMDYSTDAAVHRYTLHTIISRMHPRTCILPVSLIDLIAKYNAGNITAAKKSGRSILQKFFNL